MACGSRLDGPSISQFVHYLGAPQSLQSACCPTVAPAPKMSMATGAVQYTQDAAILFRTVNQVVHSVSASCTDACSAHTGAFCLFSHSFVDARPHIVKSGCLSYILDSLCLRSFSSRWCRLRHPSRCKAALHSLGGFRVRRKAQIRFCDASRLPRGCACAVRQVV